MFHFSSVFIPFKLKCSCMLGRGWDDMLWWLKYRHCFDAVVSYYNLKWDIMLKSVRILLSQWKGTTAKTACFSGCLKIIQRLASQSLTCFHLKHRYSFHSVVLYTKPWCNMPKLKQFQIRSLFSLLVIINHFWTWKCKKKHGDIINFEVNNEIMWFL